MIKCLSCKYYDDSVDACNAEEDDVCFMDGYQQGRADAIDEFISICEDAYPKNWANEFELGGRANHFSLNDIHRIAEQIKEQKNE